MVKTPSQRRMWQSDKHKARKLFFETDIPDMWLAPVKSTLSNNNRRVYVRVWQAGMDWFAEHWTGYITRHTTMHEAMDNLAGEIV